MSHIVFIQFILSHFQRVNQYFEYSTNWLLLPPICGVFCCHRWNWGFNIGLFLFDSFGFYHNIPWWSYRFDYNWRRCHCFRRRNSIRRRHICRWYKNSRWCHNWRHHNRWYHNRWGGENNWSDSGHFTNYITHCIAVPI